MKNLMTKLKTLAVAGMTMGLALGAKAEPCNDCITFSSKGAFKVQMTKGASAPAVNLEYSTDKTNWASYDPTKAYDAAQSGGAGDYVLYWRGENNTQIACGNMTKVANYFTITTNGTDLVACSGNIETLLDYKEVAANRHPQMGDHAFSILFMGCQGVVPTIQLPATNLTQSCYNMMFNGCTSLTAAPKLPAKNLAKSCYSSMFYGCTSLTAAPELPATEMSEYCYNGMFRDCTSLTAAPELLATNLASSCYNSMFYGCTSLTAAPELPATILTSSCYSSMFNGCTSLTAAPELPATILTSGCYAFMFKNCTSLTEIPALNVAVVTDDCCKQMFLECVKLVVNTEGPGKVWSIPADVKIPDTAKPTTSKYWATNMFANTAGTIANSSVVTPGVKYYVASAPKAVLTVTPVTGVSTVKVMEETWEVTGPSYSVYQGNNVAVTYTADKGYLFPDGNAEFTTNVTMGAAAMTITLTAEQQPVDAVEIDVKEPEHATVAVYKNKVDPANIVKGGMVVSNSTAYAVYTVDDDKDWYFKGATWTKAITSILDTTVNPAVDTNAIPAIIEATCKRAELESGESTNLVAGTYTAAPTAEMGGAFKLYPNATLIGTNVTFASNESTTSGGAIYAQAECIIKLVDSVFENNKSASRGGAIYNGSGVELTLENVAFRGNSPKTNGGAIANTPGGTVNFDGTVTLATETDTIYNTRELASGTLNWNLANGKHGLLNGYQNIYNTGTLKITVDDAITAPTNIVIATGDFSDLEGKDTFKIVDVAGCTANLVIDGEKVACGTRFYQLKTEAAGATTNLVLSLPPPEPIPFSLPDLPWNVTTNVYTNVVSEATRVDANVLSPLPAFVVYNVETATGTNWYFRGDVWTKAITNKLDTTQNPAVDPEIGKLPELIAVTCERTELGEGESTNLVAGTTYTAEPFEGYGGAFFVSGTIVGTNVTFRGNEVTYMSGQGGAICIQGGPHPVGIFEGATFDGNKATGELGGGGAICNNGGTLYVSHSCFTNNSAYGDGGALYNSPQGVATLDEVIFSGNSAKNGGAIYNAATLNFDGSVTLATDTDILYNLVGTLNWNLADGKHGLLNGYDKLKNYSKLQITIDDAIATPTNIVIATGDFTNTKKKDTFTITNALGGAAMGTVTIDGAGVGNENLAYGVKLVEEEPAGSGVTNLVLSAFEPVCRIISGDKATTNYYETVAAVAKAVKDGETVQFLRSAEIDNTIGKAVTIDLNGQYITNKYLSVNADLSIENSDSNHEGGLVNTGTVAVASSCTLDMSSLPWDEGKGGLIQSPRGTGKFVIGMCGSVRMQGLSPNWMEANAPGCFKDCAAWAVVYIKNGDGEPVEYTKLENGIWAAFDAVAATKVPSTGSYGQGTIWFEEMFTDLQKAIDSVTTNGTVTMVSGFGPRKTICVTNDYACTLDLSGYQINANFNGDVLKVESPLTILNGGEGAIYGQGANSHPIVAYTNLTIKGGMIENTNARVEAICVTNEASVFISGGTIYYGYTPSANVFISGGTFKYVKPDATNIVKGCVCYQTEKTPTWQVTQGVTLSNVNIDGTSNTVTIAGYPFDAGNDVYLVPSNLAVTITYKADDDHMFGLGWKERTVTLEADKLTGDYTMTDEDKKSVTDKIADRWVDSDGEEGGREIALDTRERIVVAEPSDVLPLAYSTNFWDTVEGGNKVSLTVTPRGGVEQQLVSTNVNGYAEWMPTVDAFGLYDVSCMTERTMEFPVTTNATIYYSTYFPLTIAEAEGGTLAAITNGIAVTGAFGVLGYEYVKLEATPADNTWVFTRWTVTTNGGEVALFEDATNAVNRFEMPLAEVQVSGGFVIAEAYRAELLANATNRYNAATNAIEKLRLNRLTDDETNEALKKAKESFDKAIGAIGGATKPTDAKTSADTLDAELDDVKKNAEKKSGDKPYDLIVADDFEAIADAGSYDPETGAFTVNGVPYQAGVNAFTSFRAACGADDTAFTTNVHVYGTQLIEDDVPNLYPWTLDLHNAILSIGIDANANLYSSITNTLSAIRGGEAIVFGKTEDGETRAVQAALADKLAEGAEIVIKPADVTPERKTDPGTGKEVIEAKVDETTKTTDGVTTLPQMVSEDGSINITVEATVTNDTVVAGKVVATNGTVTIIHEATNQALTVAGEVTAKNVVINNYGHLEADVAAAENISIKNHSVNTLVGTYEGKTITITGFGSAAISNVTFKADYVWLEGYNMLTGPLALYAAAVTNATTFYWNVQNGNKTAHLNNLDVIVDKYPKSTTEYVVVCDRDQTLGEYVLADNAASAANRKLSIKLMDGGERFGYIKDIKLGETRYPGDSRGYTLWVNEASQLVLTVEHGKFAVKAETKKGEGAVAFAGAGYAAGEAIVGTVVTNAAKPGTNWELRNWAGYYVNAVTNDLTFADPSSAVTTFEMPIGDVTVEAYFRVAKAYEQAQIGLVMTNAYRAIAELDAKTLTQAEKDALYVSITNAMWAAVANIRDLAANSTPEAVEGAQYAVSTNLDAIVVAGEALVQGRIRFAEPQYAVTEGETAEIVVYGGSESRSVSATVTLQKNTLTSYKATMMVGGKEKKVTFPLTLTWTKGEANVPQTIWIKTKKSSKVDEDKFLTLQLGSQAGCSVEGETSVPICTLTVRDAVTPTEPSKDYVRALVWPADTGKVSGYGTLKPGKTRTIKATPKTYKYEKYVWDPVLEDWVSKGTVTEKSVFAGWYAAKPDNENMIDFGNCVSTAAKFKTDEGGTYYAYFTEAPGVIEVDDPDFATPGAKGLVAETNAYNTAYAYVGAQFALPMTYDAHGDAKAKLTMKGLPGGLKYNKKTLAIEGTPVRAGEYTVTVTGKNVAGKHVITFTLIVEPLDASKVGTWEGDLVDAAGAEVGEIRIKVNKKGRISARVKYGKKSHSLNVNGYELATSNLVYSISVTKDKTGTLKAAFAEDGSLAGTVAGEKFGNGASFEAVKTK